MTTRVNIRPAIGDAISVFGGRPVLVAGSARDAKAGVRRAEGAHHGASGSASTESEAATVTAQSDSSGVFRFDPHAVYPIELLERELAGIASLRALLDSLCIKRRLRHAIYGWEILEAFKRLAAEPQTEPPATHVVRTGRRGRPSRANPARPLTKVRRAVAARKTQGADPMSPLLQTAAGVPWSKNSLSCAWRRLLKAAKGKEAFVS